MKRSYRTGNRRLESENQYRDSLQMVAENYVTIGKKTTSVESDIKKCSPTQKQTF
jgi:hypothetical protein